MATGHRRFRAVTVLQGCRRTHLAQGHLRPTIFRHQAFLYSDQKSFQSSSVWLTGMSR